MSQRDRLRALQALAHLTGGKAGVTVAVADVDERIGRGHGDMRTPLDLQRLADEGLAAAQPGGGWALTTEGVAWLRRDGELSGR